MSCAVALTGSPVFSPSLTVQDYSPRFLKASATFSSSPSPENLTMCHHSPLRRVISSSSREEKLSPFKSEGGASSSFPASRAHQKQTGFRICKKGALVLGEEGSTVLKRKRPTALRLDIPSSADFLPSPHNEAAPKEIDLENDRFSVYCKRGRREVMEDCYTAALDLQGDPKQAFFGVFDGHGGKKAAEFASENIEKNIMDQVMESGGDGIEEAVKNGYLTTDSAFLKEEVRGGTCCVTALIRNGDLIVSNAGDCRAVMSRQGTGYPLTSDHRPSREDERRRIESLGGYVDICRGVWRLHGSLAVSRGIGDLHLKQWVSAEPETKIIRITPECEFLILASDGLWDYVDNQEAVDIARSLCIATENPSPLSACKKLADLSVSRGSVDDVSVMIIQLGHFM